MIVVVDYGAANLLSITRALEACGAEVVVSGEPEALRRADGIVLPGVGAAGAAMTNLRASGCDVALVEAARAGRPLLGVCLGMQLLFEELEEDGARGLGLLRGTVPALPPGRKIPHMGWNRLTWDAADPQAGVFEGLESGGYVYFVHSYHCVPAEAEGAALAWTDYGGPICAAVARSELFGVQFHPEKSGATGLRLLRNWLRRVRSPRDGAALSVAQPGVDRATSG